MNSWLVGLAIITASHHESKAFRGILKGAVHLVPETLKLSYKMHWLCHLLKSENARKFPLALLKDQALIQMTVFKYFEMWYSFL